MFLHFVRVGVLISVVAWVVQAQETAQVLPSSSDANKSAARPPVARAAQLVAGKDFSLRRAYNDVFAMLSFSNTCSDFYGGPQLATAVLDQLIDNVKPGDLPEFISFQMTGRPRDFLDVRTGGSYRLFDKAIVNRTGAFYERRFGSAYELPRNVGSFLPGTRAARALILLHELAHLIKGPGGAWLIKDDGVDRWQSRQNTARVERACSAELRALN